MLAGLFGISPEALPPDWASFEAYIAEMCGSQALGVSDRARYMAQQIMTGAGSWIPIPRWYQALTAEWMPERLREEFGLKFGRDERIAAQRAHRWLPRVYSKLPFPLRYVGPYLEAQARLEEREAGFLARRSNVFWIGQPRMPFNK